MSWPSLSIAQMTVRSVNEKFNAIQGVQIGDIPGLLPDAQVIFATRSPNTVFAGPSSGALSVAPTWRALVAADIPNLDAAKITTGQLALARGGTNADLSGTGGANKFVKQSGVGAAFTVGAIGAGDVPDAALTSNVFVKNTAGQLGSTTQFGASCFNSIGQSIPNLALTTITFDSENFDQGNTHSVSASTSRITVPTGGGGIWLVIGAVTLLPGAGTWREAQILSSGSAIALNVTPPVSGGTITSIQVSVITSAADGAYFELAAAQDSGGAVNTVGGQETLLMAIKLF